jgi:hypothetical protein
VIVVVERPAARQPLGLGTCPACGDRVIWALNHDGGVLAVDLSPNFMGLAAWWVVELYHEVFPDGDPVDGLQRVRVRPPWRGDDAPAWMLHTATCRRTWGTT